MFKLKSLKEIPLCADVESKMENGTKPKERMLASSQKRTIERKNGRDE